MALDLHVMPLWRWYSGEFQSPVEKLGVKVMRLGRPKSQMSSSEAKSYQKKIHNAFAKVIEINPLWDLKRDGAFSKQFPVRFLHLARAYAAYLERPPKTGLTRRATKPFQIPDDVHSYPPLKKITRPDKTKFSHLHFHEDDAGWYVPVDFELPIPPIEGCPSVGSSVRLHSELSVMATELALGVNWRQFTANSNIFDNDPLGDLKYATLFLLHCSKMSIHFKLPIIFDG